MKSRSANKHLFISVSTIISICASSWHRIWNSKGLYYCFSFIFMCKLYKKLNPFLFKFKSTKKFVINKKIALSLGGTWQHTVISNVIQKTGKISHWNDIEKWFGSLAMTVGILFSKYGKKKEKNSTYFFSCVLRIVEYNYYICISHFCFVLPLKQSIQRYYIGIYWVNKQKLADWW